MSGTVTPFEMTFMERSKLQLWPYSSPLKFFHIRIGLQIPLGLLEIERSVLAGYQSSLSERRGGCTGLPGSMGISLFIKRR